MKRCLSIILLVFLLASVVSFGFSEGASSPAESILGLAAEPTLEPTAELTPEPTLEPTAELTPEPAAEPTLEATAEPTPEATAGPTPEAKEPAQEETSTKAGSGAILRMLPANLIPFNLTVSDNSFNSLTLSWSCNNSPGDITGFQIERSTNRDTGYTLVKTVGVVYTTSISGLTCGTKYFFRIRAVNATSTLVDYSAHNIEPAPGTPRPGAPTITACTVTGVSEIKIEWSSVAGATGYELYRGVDGATPVSLGLGTSVSTLRSYTDKDVVMDRTYTYYVCAYRIENGAQILGAPSSSKTLECLPPAPTGLEGKSTSLNSIQLTWKAVAGVEGYAVYRNDTTIASSVATNTYADNNLLFGQTYQYKVASYVTVNGNKVIGNACPVVSIEATVPKPTNLSVKSTTSKITVTWDPISMVAGYELRWRPVSGTSWQPLVNIVGDSSASYELTASNVNAILGSSAPLGYEFQVSAYTLYGVHPMPRIWSPRIVGFFTPSKPEAFQANVVNHNTIKLTWSKPVSLVGGIHGYEIHRSVGAGTMKFYRDLDIRSWPNMAYNSDGSLVAGETYSYKMRSYSLESGVKYYSAFTSISSAVPIPVAPINLKATPIDSGIIKLTWDPVAGANGYQIYMRPVDQPTMVYAGSTAGANSCTFSTTGLTTGREMFFRVRAYRTDNTVNGAQVNGMFSDGIKETAVPGKPTGISITSPNETTLTLKWNPVAGATEYQIFQTENNDPFPINPIATITGTSRTFYNRTPGRTYKYYVIPCMKANGVLMEGIQSATVSRRMMPAMPTEFTATATNENYNTLTWKSTPFSSSLTRGYEIEWYDSSNTPIPLIDLMSPSEQQFLDQKANRASSGLPSLVLTPGRTNKYRIRSYVISSTAQPEKIYSGWSLISYAITRPNSVKNLKVTSTGITQLKLEWAWDASAYRYEIQRCENTSFSPASAVSTELYGPLSTSGPLVTYTGPLVKNLVTGKTYYYRIAAKNNGVNSNYSAVVSGKPVPNATTMTGATPLNVSTVRLWWNQVGTIKTYVVYCWEGSTAGLMRRYSVTGTPNANGRIQYDVPGLSMNTKYIFVVHAVHNGVEGQRSNQKDATTKLNAPGSFTAAPMGNENIKLSWNQVPGAQATGYYIERRIAPGVPPTGAYGSWSRIRTVLTPANTTNRMSITIKQGSGYTSEIRICAYRTVNGITIQSDWVTLSGIVSIP